MNVQAMVTGARLAFVVAELEGTVRREKVLYDKKKHGGLKRIVKEEPAGYLVYFPRGHVVRIRTLEQLAHFGLDKKPHIINISGLHNPDSPIGKVLSGQDEETRAGAYQDMQKQVIQLATAKTGTRLMPEQFEEIAPGQV